MIFHPIGSSHPLRIDRSSDTGCEWEGDSNALARANIEFLADLLLETARKQSVEPLLQKGVRRALVMPAAPIAVIRQIDGGYGI